MNSIHFYVFSMYRFTVQGFNFNDRISKQTFEYKLLHRFNYLKDNYCLGHYPVTEGGWHIVKRGVDNISLVDAIHYISECNCMVMTTDGKLVQGQYAIRLYSILFFPHELLYGERNLEMALKRLHRSLGNMVELPLCK